MVGLQKVSSEQWEFLLSYMEGHPDMARGTQANDGARSKLAVNELWEALAESLNNLGSYTKSVSEWRNYWKRQRYEVRKKAQERRAASSKMDGAPLPRHLELSPREQRVLRALALTPSTVFGGELRIPYPEEDPLSGAEPVVPAGPPERAPSADEPDPRTFCTTTLDIATPARPDRSRPRVLGGPVPVSRPYRRFPVPPDVWSLQIEDRRLRLEAKRAFYEKNRVTLQERQLRAAETNNEIMTQILGQITRIADALQKYWEQITSIADAFLK